MLHRAVAECQASANPSAMARCNDLYTDKQHMYDEGRNRHLIQVLE